MTADTLTDTVASPSHAPTYPAHWLMARLGEIGNIIGGSTPSTKVAEYWNGRIPWLTPNEVTRAADLKIADTERHITEQGLANCSANLLPAGTVMMTSRATIGEVAINTVPMATNQGFINVICDSATIFNEFLAYWLMLHKSALVSRASGSTFLEISKSSFRSIPIMLPPLAEQRAIARILRTAQDAIAARRSQVTLERERKAALIQRIFTYGVHGEPTKQTEISEIPESWQIVRLGEIAGIERGKFSHRPRNDPEFYGGHVPFIQTGDVTAANGRIFTYTQTLNEQGLAVSRMFPKGTIVITIAANIGYTGILEFDSAFPDSLIGITAGVGVEVRYLHYYLVTQQPEMDRRAPQGTQKNINIEFLSPWPVRLPPVNEQREIADTLTACDTHIAALEREIALHEELFRALLEELMSGRLSALGLVEGNGEVISIVLD